LKNGAKLRLCLRAHKYFLHIFPHSAVSLIYVKQLFVSAITIILKSNAQPFLFHKPFHKY